MIISFDPEAFHDFQAWASNDKKIFKKNSELIKDVTRTPFQGLGKPEGLKGNLSGYWSRRITDEHRLVYKVSNDVLCIISCKFH
ncbi:MAG: Txe/YoeB family addiction module toxin [Spirochaetaceae bacterium]|nr:Txe/YoeB family addiction module toxin [Spirochaetaceae bacterium]